MKIIRRGLSQDDQHKVECGECRSVLKFETRESTWQTNGMLAITCPVCGELVLKTLQPIW